MPGYMIVKNHRRAPRSFRCILTIDGKKQRLRDGFLVEVPGCDPNTGTPGVSKPVPEDFLRAANDNEVVVRLFEEGILSAESVTT